LNIHSPATASIEVVSRNAELMGAFPVFLNEILPRLWTAALDYDINPVGMAAQSFKETGGGAFTGKVKAWFYNPAGIKVHHDDKVMTLLGTADHNHPLVHQMFPNWDVGTVAHAQRLCDYTLTVFDDLVVDPRHGMGNRGITEWAELGGRWAPSLTYGEEIEEMMRRLVVP
jgi:N-acetylmuramoyl-L-alanine amidase